MDNFIIMFPLEIIDLIILHTDFETSIRLNNEYTLKKLYNPDKHSWYWAAYKGHLEVVEWLHKNRKEGCPTWAMEFAARYGHLKVVEFLHKNRKEGCTTRAMNLAAANGHLDIVEYLRKVEQKKLKESG
jgi:hypothetical protein